MVVTVIMWVMAICAILGGLDRIAGNRLGLGKSFEEGFEMLGPLALSMAGIICVVPLISTLLEHSLVIVWQKMHMDPGMLGSLFAIDMGGYQLSTSLAENASVGLYSGIIASSTFGCAITFLIPVGMGMLSGADQSDYANGILVGLGVLPVVLIIGGLMLHLSILTILWQSLPLLIISVLLIWGLSKAPRAILKGFKGFSIGIRCLGTLALAAAAAEFMTGTQLIPGLGTLKDAMATVSAIGIVMLGSLPFAEILQRLLKKPLTALGARFGLNNYSVTGLLLSIVTPMPTIALIPKMDPRGRVLNGMFLVTSGSVFAAHIGYTFSVAPAAIPALLVAKIGGGILCLPLGMLLTRKKAVEGKG